MHDHNHLNTNSAADNINILHQSFNRTDDFQVVSDLFKLLDDPTRVRIFWLLCHVEECVSEIASWIEMSSPAVSHHLKLLKGCGLITSRREGKEVYYKAAADPRSELLHQMIELMMEISCPEEDVPISQVPVMHPLDEHTEIPDNVRLTSFQSEQIDAIHEIHTLLISNLDKRYSVDELARKYLMNPTTLKTLFKTVYGMSIAAHVKEHRMEEAGRLLRDTNLSISEISSSVGYTSQSKFASAFKEIYHVLPRDYRAMTSKQKPEQ